MSYFNKKRHINTYCYYSYTTYNIEKIFIYYDMTKFVSDVKGAESSFRVVKNLFYVKDKLMFVAKNSKISFEQEIAPCKVVKILCWKCLIADEQPS